jgi:hypothetical protein
LNYTILGSHSLTWSCAFPIAACFCLFCLFLFILFPFLVFRYFFFPFYSVYFNFLSLLTRRHRLFFFSRVFSSTISYTGSPVHIFWRSGTAKCGSCCYDRRHANGLPPWSTCCSPALHWRLSPFVLGATS